MQHLSKAAGQFQRLIIDATHSGIEDDTIGRYRGDAKAYYDSLKKHQKRRK